MESPGVVKPRPLQEEILELGLRVETDVVADPEVPVLQDEALDVDPVSPGFETGRPLGMGGRFHLVVHRAVPRGVDLDFPSEVQGQGLLGGLDVETALPIHAGLCRQVLEEGAELRPSQVPDTLVLTATA